MKEIDYDGEYQVLEDHMDLKECFSHIEAWRPLFTKNISIASATGYKATALGGLSPEEIAERGVNPLELDGWRLYKKGNRIKTINWAESHEPSKVSPKTGNERLRALWLAADNKDLTLNHLQWVYSNTPAIIPVLTALVRVERARHVQANEPAGFTPLQRAEWETLRRARKVVRKRNECGRLGAIGEELSKWDHHLTARIRYLQAAGRKQGGEDLSANAQS